MKKLFIMFALITSNAIVAGNVKNLIRNVDFEKLNSEGVPLYWEFNYSQKALGTSAEVKVSNEKVKSSKNSVVFSCRGDNGSYFAIRQTVKGFAPNDKLDIKADVYIENFDSGSIQLFYFIVSGKENVYLVPLEIKPNDCETNQWINYNATIDLSKHKEIKELLFWVLVPKGFEGKFFVDNISITKQKQQ